MTYASAADIAEIYGADQLARLMDSDGDGISENASIARALTYTDAQINSYLGVRYALPLPATPDLVKMLAIDIAVYRIAQDHTRLTDEMAKRYDDAIRQLDKLATGKAVLPIPTTSGAPEVAAQADAVIVVDAPERLFDRATLRGL